MRKKSKVSERMTNTDLDTKFLNCCVLRGVLENGNFHLLYVLNTYI